MPSKDSNKLATAKGPYPPVVSVTRGSMLLSKSDHSAASAHEKTAASSKATAKGPVTPPPTTAANGFKNKPTFQPPAQDNSAKERPPTSNGIRTPVGARRS